jgi:hypothetical protein
MSPTASWFPARGATRFAFRAIKLRRKLLAMLGSPHPRLKLSSFPSAAPLTYLLFILIYDAPRRMTHRSIASPANGE